MEEFPRYLERMKKFVKWNREYKYRMGEEIKEYKYSVNEEENKCRVCGYEKERIRRMYWKSVSWVGRNIQKGNEEREAEE